MIETQPMQSLHILKSRPNLSLGLSLQFFTAIFKSQPSGISPSKKGNRILLSYGFSCNGKVRLIGLTFSLFK